jgi:hypothetical protein
MRVSRKNCHNRTMIHSETDQSFKNEHTSCVDLTEWWGSMTREGVRRGVGRRELKKREREMKDHVDESNALVIKQELKGIHICGCRCNERLKDKTDGSTRLSLHWVTWMWRGCVPLLDKFCHRSLWCCCLFSRIEKDEDPGKENVVV